METGVRQALSEDATSVAKLLDLVIGERRCSALDTPFSVEEKGSFIRITNEVAVRSCKGLGFAEIGRASRQVKIDRKYDDEILLELFLEPMASC